MPKRISEKIKQEIIEDFFNNKTLEEISEKYNFTKLTISRNLKKLIGKDKYNELIKITKSDKELSLNNSLIDNDLAKKNGYFESLNQDSISESAFMEIPPLDYQIDNLPRKDLSSVPIAEVELPKIVYMLVDNKIELEPKLLKEYIDWNFLSEQELNRKTIEIYFDLKMAKRSCSKEQKVIKVPNSNVFKVAAPILISRGISRIVSSDLLIAL